MSLVNNNSVNMRHYLLVGVFFKRAANDESRFDVLYFCQK